MVSSKTSECTSNMIFETHYNVIKLSILKCEANNHRWINWNHSTLSERTLSMFTNLSQLFLVYNKLKFFNY